MYMTEDLKDMTDEEKRERIIRLGFAGDERRFEQFCAKLRAELPPGTGVALRGSTLTGKRWEDGAPFDADGAGTSDLDVTFIGRAAMEYWQEDEFYIPALHTKPLGDKAPAIAPALNPLREELQRMVGRPVNIQGTVNFIMYARDVLLGQPYFTLIEADEGAAS